ASQILLCGTEEFNAQNATYAAQQNSEIVPAAIFLPEAKEDVAEFIRLITPTAKDGSFAFVIRGGGACPLPYGTNIEKPGITLDLAHLNQITVLEESVSIGAGASWGAVYEALDGTGRGVSGSRSSKGGIGGLALQGGLSFFSSREGCIADNVLSYEIVLAFGEIVNASATEKSDLWKALRGGSNNFGIVTRFEFRTFLQ
ncbi:FAD-binding domain-containing protein, partial [Lophiostoma macrostomum CBS 122681]